MSGNVRDYVYYTVLNLLCTYTRYDYENNFDFDDPCHEIRANICRSAIDDGDITVGRREENL